MEEIVRYLAENQRIMSENMTVLTEIQRTQQEQINTISLKQQEFDQKHLEAEQKQRAVAAIGF